MSIHGKRVDDITESDLAELIANGVPEGTLIEFKRDNYRRSDADVKEFLKDLTSFANTQGGHLIVGMNESKGIADQVTPIANIDPDLEKQRYESLILDGVEPRISGVGVAAIPISSGGHVLVFHTPKSWNAPHRVSARGTNRIYARTSAGAYELSIDQLRLLFLRSATELDRARSYRAERLSRISANDPILPLANDGGRLVIHIIPLGAFAESTQIDIEKAYALHNLLRPIASEGYSPTINFDGLVNWRGGSECYGYTQIFRNGIIEATKVRIVSKHDGRSWIPSIPFDKSILEIVPSYFDALQQLGASPPFATMISLQGVRNATLGIKQDWFLEVPPPITRDSLDLPEVIVTAFGDAVAYQRALRPAFDALWNSAGFAKSKYFDDDGKWIGEAGLRQRRP